MLRVSTRPVAGNPFVSTNITSVLAAQTIAEERGAHEPSPPTERPSLTGATVLAFLPEHLRASFGYVNDGCVLRLEHLDGSAEQRACDIHDAAEALSLAFAPWPEIQVAASAMRIEVSVAVPRGPRPEMPVDGDSEPDLDWGPISEHEIVDAMRRSDEVCAVWWESSAGTSSSDAPPDVDDEPTSDDPALRLEMARVFADLDIDEEVA